MRRLFWDYFGPRAAGTAEHFHRHLDAFLAAEGLSGCQTGVEHLGPAHSAAFCDAPHAHCEAIAARLRPRRSGASPPA